MVAPLAVLLAGSDPVVAGRANARLAEARAAYAHAEAEYQVWFGPVFGPARRTAAEVYVGSWGGSHALYSTPLGDGAGPATGRVTTPRFSAGLTRSQRAGWQVADLGPPKPGPTPSPTPPAARPGTRPGTPTCSAGGSGG